MAELQTGDKAPDFSLPTDSTGTFTLSEHKGKNIVLFFYPKDDTSGCTVENIDFTALKPEFDKLNTILVGISADSIKRHENFRKKHELDVILVSDPEKEAIEKYGVWVEKQMYGRTYFGIERATFLIDENGKIAHVWRKVRAKEHAAAVLDHIKQGA